jgi:hypothetical protein
MAAHLPRLPFLLFVFLAVHAPACHGDPAQLLNNYDDSMCSESFMCGSVNITYPFYLSNEIRETSDYIIGNYSCGYTDLNITCQGEGASATPVIRLGGENYTIQDISYGGDTPTVILADSDVLVGGSCPAVHNISFDGKWLRNSNSNDNLTFYFGCYAPETPVPRELEKYQINCNGSQRPVPGGGVAFVLTTDDHDKAQEYAFSTHCEEVVSMPVKPEVMVEVARNWTNFTRGAYGYVLKQGFELEWRRIETDQCPLCEQSGGKCSYSQNKIFLGCLCSDRRVSYTDCGPSKSLTLNILFHSLQFTLFEISVVRQ